MHAGTSLARQPTVSIAGSLLQWSGFVPKDGQTKLARASMLACHAVFPFIP